MLSVARLLGEFGTGAEAHEAYVVTELGNLFPVETPNAGPIGSNAGLGALSSGVTQALLGFMSGIIDKETDFKYVTGTGSVGELHDYSAFFTIPDAVSNSTDGYAAVYRSDAPHTSVSPLKFFGTYSYNNSTNTLSDHTSLEANDPYTSIKTQGYFSSRQDVSGSVYSNGYGFDASFGSYIVKLHDGKTYAEPSGIYCAGGTCNRASIITSDRDLFATTDQGLHLMHASSFTYGSTVSSGSKTEFWSSHQNNGLRAWDYTIQPTVTYNGGNRITSGNIVDYDGVSLDYEFNQSCYNGGVNPISPVTNAVFSGPFISTQTVNGKQQLTSVEYRSHDNWGFSHYWTYHDRPRCIIPVTVTWQYDSASSSVNSRKVYSVASSQFNSNTLIYTGTIRPPAIYDSGIPVDRHLAYWAENGTSVFHTTSNTVTNPPYFSVSGSDKYMIIENKLGHNLYVDGFDTASANLRITNLPPNTLFSLTATGMSPVVGSTGQVGEIIIPNSSTFDGKHDLTLNLFHDSVVFRNLSGMTVIDHVNDWEFNIAGARHDNVIFTTTKYVNMPIPLDNTEITGIGIGLGNCGMDKLPLNYLDDTYNGGDNLLVPVIPGYDRACFEMGNRAFTLKFNDINHENTEYGGTAGGASTKNGASGSGRISSSQDISEIPVTMTSSGTTEFVIEGAIQADSNISFRKEYKGPLAEPPGTVSEVNIFAERTAAGGSACRGNHMANIVYAAANDSDVPTSRANVYIDIVVSKNNVEVLTKRIFTANGMGTNIPVTDNATPSVSGYFSVLLQWFGNNGGGARWCIPAMLNGDDEGELMHAAWSAGNAARCYELTQTVYPQLSITYSIPICDATPVSTCGYDVSHVFSNNVFSDTITINNLEIGDVVMFEMSGGINAELDDYNCFGDANGNENYRGVQNFKVLNPSVQAQ